MTKQPEDTIRDGAIKATIWRNEGENGPYLSADLARTYQDAEGNLKDSRSFGIADLLKVAEVARNAYGRGREIEMDLRQERQAIRDQERERHTGQKQETLRPHDHAPDNADRKAFVEKRQAKAAPQQRREPSR
ncbi:MAG: hypothetical protein AAFX04_13190 [Pseudomonadota bacterium]